MLTLILNAYHFYSIHSNFVFNFFTKARYMLTRYVCNILIKIIKYLFHIKIPWALSPRSFYNSLNNMSSLLKISPFVDLFWFKTRFRPSKMEEDCHPSYAFRNKYNFSAFSNITCGFSAFSPFEKEFVQISDCSKDVSGHLRSLKLGQDSIPSEGHSFLLRIEFFSSILNNFNICPNHRVKLGVKWERHSVKCSYPDHSHNGKMERPVTPQMSRLILEHKGELVPVGSG